MVSGFITLHPFHSSNQESYTLLAINNVQRLLYTLICLNLDSIFYHYNLIYLRILMMAPFRADIKFHLMRFHFFHP